ncbi:MAG: RluA family pseudouridine synthase [Clostridia bacterium]|nr:RluA family pseudouridine synthase [Clostridia bacterium]MBQ8504969.1 RluA family pseudouridine synthase [Clostridia bacterium]MBQ8772637.1 RluA family pseudouridine synthase [Clostridia bacterium]MBQ8872906.1 RluA family pseudouridine synthase [Clostridia bacterium]MBR7176586.1 RluA family pseudouridine synthase [Clostridia bacterium]
MKQIQLVCEQSQRLDSFVAENSTLTRSHAQKLVQGGSVTVDGAVVTKCSLVVKEDSVVCVTLPDEQSLDIPAQDIPLDILYEDSHMAVINKQQGLTVHPANGVNTDTLVNALLFHIKDLSGINGVLRPGIVHRLDKDTSGLLVVAKNDQAHVELQRQIQTKECKRIYWALVEGVVKQDQGIVNQPIGRCPTDRKRMDIVAGGRQAETHFTVLKRFDRYTLMQFELKTGRTHQIRVHSRFLGHPVVGDKTYGFKNCKFNLSGQLLHAKTISFTHPVSGEQMTFSAPLPSYFDKILQTLTNKSK